MFNAGYCSDIVLNAFTAKLQRKLSFSYCHLSENRQFYHRTGS